VPETQAGFGPHAAPHESRSPSHGGAVAPRPAGREAAARHRQRAASAQEEAGPRRQERGDGGGAGGEAWRRSASLGRCRLQDSNTHDLYSVNENKYAPKAHRVLYAVGAHNYVRSGTQTMRFSRSYTRNSTTQPLALGVTSPGTSPIGASALERDMKV
jgi:hypothetical protein